MSLEKKNIRLKKKFKEFYACAWIERKGNLFT